MINSASDNSKTRTWLVNHTLHLYITVHHVCGNNFVASDCSQILLRNILFHISNIHFWFHVISNYFVGNNPFPIDFYQTGRTDSTSRRMDCINSMPHQIFNAYSIIFWIYFSSVGHIFILFTSLKVKKVFINHGYKFRYIILYEKLPFCIKDPHHEYNNLVDVGYIGSWCDKASFDLPGSSPSHLYIWYRSAL